MRVFKCYATERSGHHSVMFWLLHQNKKVEGYESYGKFDPVIRCDQPNYQAVLFDNLAIDQSYLGGKNNPPYKTNDSKLKLVILGYERCKISELQNHIFINYETICGKNIDTKEIIILRDFKNTIASLVNKCRNHQIPNPKMTIPIWKDRAQAILSHKYYFINYNKYNSDINYRQQVCIDLGLEFTDIAFDYLTPSGGGSSFDSKTGFNTRYKQLQNSHGFYQTLKEYSDCVELSKEIFGNV